MLFYRKKTFPFQNVKTIVIFSSTSRVEGEHINAAYVDSTENDNNFGNFAASTKCSETSTFVLFFFAILVYRV